MSAAGIFSRYFHGIHADGRASILRHPHSRIEAEFGPRRTGRQRSWRHRQHSRTNQPGWRGVPGIIRALLTLRHKLRAKLHGATKRTVRTTDRGSACLVKYQKQARRITALVCRTASCPERRIRPAALDSIGPTKLAAVRVEIRTHPRGIFRQDSRVAAKPCVGGVGGVRAVA